MFLIGRHKTCFEAPTRGASCISFPCIGSWRALTFTRTHPASEVYVTGTFDDWGKTVKLDKKGDAFEKLVTLPKTDEKVFYKVS